jgi:thiol:disulfide interchange protein DsbD
MKRLYSVVTFIFFLLAFSTQTFSQPAFSSAGKVSIETKNSVDKIPAGSSFNVAVIVKIADGWHVNSHTPSTPDLIGAKLDVEPKDGFIIADVSYPKGSDEKLSFSDSPLNVYQGNQIIFLNVKTSKNLKNGADTLHASLLVQACNNQICLAPSSILIIVPIEIVGANETVTAINKNLFSSYNGPAESAVSSNDIGTLFQEKGGIIAFLAIFLIGLALNLTPCVYPMLSVTVSIFGAQNDTNMFRVFLKAATYVIGIATMYSVLGVVAALGGGLFGSWLQSPVVLGGIGVLLIGLSLSSFGLYQIQMPYWLTSKLGGTTGTGIISLYLSGLVVGVFAAPCVGPPVIALLAFVSAKADPVFGFWVFFTLSLGLGLPYLILGTFSGMLKKIPRSGEWMVWVEKIFGVVLSGAGVFYLSLAIVPKYSVYVIPLTLFLGGIYLGFLERSGRDKKILLRIKWIFGTIAVAAGILIGSSLREQGMQWEQYSETRLAEAQHLNKPVMMDFYADWCIPCLELDHKTFTDKKVIDATEDFVRLKVDLTYFDSPQSESLRKKYNIAGVPTIVFLNGRGDEVAASRIVGYLPPKEFIQRTEAAL